MNRTFDCRDQQMRPYRKLLAVITLVAVISFVILFQHFNCLQNFRVNNVRKKHLKQILDYFTVSEDFFVLLFLRNKEKMFYISLRNLLSFRKSNFNFSVIQMLWRHEMANDEMRNTFY